MIDVPTITYDPKTVQKARFWKSVSQWFTMAIVTITVLLVGGVLFQTLLINSQIKRQITDNARSRNSQLMEIEGRLDTIHAQADANRKAYNDYQTCLSTTLQAQGDIKACDTYQPQQN